jgi:hypothetical protein
MKLWVSLLSHRGRCMIFILGHCNRKLVTLVEQFGLRKWSCIAQILHGRVGKQCRERWHNHLRPDIKVHPTAPLSMLPAYKQYRFLPFSVCGNVELLECSIYYTSISLFVVINIFFLFALSSFVKYLSQVAVDLIPVDSVNFG